MSIIKLVACYVRVSTENQLENYSIEEQIDRLKAFCKAKDYTIYKVYTDGGYSGGNINRPALQQMLSDCTEHKVDAVIVYKLDRLSRSQKDTLTLIEDEFLSNNIDFISVSENFDTSTPFGRAMIGILSVFAQLEKDQITERFTMGRIGRSRAGYFHGGGNAPKGYRYVEGQLVVDEYEAIQVREVFDLFLSGKSIHTICSIMSEKYGNLWDRATKVRNALNNSLYCGKVKFKGEEYQGQHQPIISVEVYKKVEALMTSRANEESAAQKTPFRAGYVLSSLIYCGKCGARYCADHGYYKCYSRSKSNKNYIVDPNCKNNNWQIPELDVLVIKEIERLTLENNFNELCKRYDGGQSKKAKKETEAIKKNILLADTQISKLLDLYQLDNMPIEQLSQKISYLQENKIRLQKLLDDMCDNDVDARRQEFAKQLKSFKAMLNSGIEERRLFISSLVEQVIVQENHIEIKWRL